MPLNVLKYGLISKYRYEILVGLFVFVYVFVLTISRDSNE